MKRLYNKVKHCKKCNSIDLTFMSKGRQFIGDFGDLYKCETCGQVNDDFIIEEVEYTGYEYFLRATEIDKLSELPTILKDRGFKASSPD